MFTKSAAKSRVADFLKQQKDPSRQPQAYVMMKQKYHALAYGSLVNERWVGKYRHDTCTSHSNHTCPSAYCHLVPSSVLYAWQGCLSSDGACSSPSLVVLHAWKMDF